MGNFKYQLIFAGIITACFGLFGYSKAATVIGQPKFTSNSTFTAGHVYSIIPAGGHPAAGSHKQVQYNCNGGVCGAAYLIYTSSYFGVGKSPDRPLVVSSDNNVLAAGNSSILLAGEKNTERFEIRSYRGTTTGPQPTFQGFAGYSFASRPKPVRNNTNLFTLAGFGWNGTAFGGSDPAANSAAALIGMYASEQHSTTAKGSYIAFQTTANTTTSRSEKVRITGAGNVGIGTTAPTSPLHAPGIPAYGGASIGAANTTAKAAGHTAGAFFLWSTAGARQLSAVW